MIIVQQVQYKPKKWKTGDFVFAAGPQEVFCKRVKREGGNERDSKRERESVSE